MVSLNNWCSHVENEIKGDLILLKHLSICKVLHSFIIDPNPLLMEFWALRFRTWIMGFGHQPARENKFGSFKHQVPKQINSCYQVVDVIPTLKMSSMPRVGWPSCASLPGIIPVLALKVLFPKRTPMPRQTWPFGHPFWSKEYKIKASMYWFWAPLC